MTSLSPAARTTAAGRLSIIAFQIVLASSYPASPGRHRAPRSPPRRDSSASAESDMLFPSIVLTTSSAMVSLLGLEPLRISHTPGASPAFCRQAPELLLVEQCDLVTLLAEPLDLHQLEAGIAAGGLQGIG